jgi:hypothetical protein
VYENERECLEVIDKINQDDLRPEELLQSKITNMITYIHKKLTERGPGVIKKDKSPGSQQSATNLKPESIPTFLIVGTTISS